MAFPNKINTGLARGVPGDIATYSPHRGTARFLQSTDAANNVFGRYFTLNTVGEEVYAQAGGMGAFGGILVHSKEHARCLCGNDPLFSLPNGKWGTLLEMGCVYIQLPTGVTAKEGDLVKYTVATGVLGVGEVTPPAEGQDATEAQVPNAVIYRGNVADGDIAVIKITN